MSCLCFRHVHSLVLICSNTLRIDCFIFCCFWLAAWSHGLFWNVAFVPLLVLNSFVDVSCAGADNDNFYKMTNKLHQLERLCHRAMDFWNVAFVPLLVLNSFVDVSCAGADNDNFYKMTNKLHQLERLCHRAMDVALDI